MKSKFSSDKSLPQSLLNERQVVRIRMSQYLWRSLIDGPLKPQQRVHKFSWICLQDCTLKEAETLAFRNIHIQTCLHSHFPTYRQIQCQILNLHRFISWIMGFKTVEVLGFKSALSESKCQNLSGIYLLRCFQNNKVRECTNTLQVTCHSGNLKIILLPSRKKCVSWSISVCF